jgi:hypothetical protein
VAEGPGSRVQGPDDEGRGEVGTGGWRGGLWGTRIEGWRWRSEMRRCCAST